jgi:hypothetical protein
MTTITLRDIEALEFQCVDLAARADTTPVRRTELAETLAKIRALKAQYLREHSSVLSKGSAKLARDPATHDKPNAKNPDSMLGSNGVDERVFRAPGELHGLSVYTCRGQMNIPDHGIVHINAAHEDLASELKGRNFKEMRQVDRAGKCADGSDPSDSFHRSRLIPIGGVDVLRGLSDRATKAAALPFETRVEAHDGPGPAATFAGSLAAFRRKYFGEE